MTTKQQRIDVSSVIELIGNAWLRKEFDGLEDCFMEDAVIVGPNHAVFAEGRSACAASYVEFASNADIFEYSESDQVLRVWGDTAVYTFKWVITYQRSAESKSEVGTDQLVLCKTAGAWRVAFRYIHFSN